MDLFSEHQEQPFNLLPRDGEVIYYGKIFTREEADYFMERLLETIAWKPDEAVIFGRHIFTSRKVAWYGDREFSYTYSKITRTAIPWTTELRQLKTIAESATGATYNSCLLNLYHHGKEGMAWHSDGEKDLQRHGAIASMSFGASRKFSFKHKSGAPLIHCQLEHGSLLVMKGATQDHWLHRLPPTALVKAPRVNLTFRTIITPEMQR